jgi:hypothetical protein
LRVRSRPPAAQSAWATGAWRPAVTDRFADDGKGPLLRQARQRRFPRESAAISPHFERPRPPLAAGLGNCYGAPAPPHRASMRRAMLESRAPLHCHGPVGQPKPNGSVRGRSLAWRRSTVKAISPANAECCGRSPRAMREGVAESCGTEKREHRRNRRQ